MDIKERQFINEKKDVIGFFEYNLIDKGLTLNKEARNILGNHINTKDSILSLLKLIPEAEHNKIRNLLKVITEKGDYSIGFPFKNSQENEIYIYSQGKLLYDNNHSPHKIIGSIQDITDLKAYLEKDLKNINEKLHHSVQESNRMLSSSEQQFKVLLESIPQMAWTALPNGYRNYFNQRWYDYTGQTYEEAKGDGWKATQHPDDLSTTNEEYNKLIRGETYINEHRFRRASDNMWRWHLTRATPIKNSKGEITLWVGTCTDIHDLKTALDNLARIKKELLLSNNELTSKNEQLTKINKDLDNFVYATSHDLKAPIHNIEGLVHVLTDEFTDCSSQAESVIVMIDKSISRFKEIITDLGKIGKSIQAISKDIEKVNLPNILKEVELDIKELIDESKAVINEDFHVTEIDFSRKNTRSIIYNLLSNAIKYRRPNVKPQIRISTQLTEDKFVLLTVEDNGMGIKKEDIPKVFSMYERIHTHIEGTGIGMALVKRILDNSAGKIEVESEIGKGTTFKVFIPLEDK
jgi:PAS domain S-box-containing protein